MSGAAAPPAAPLIVATAGHVDHGKTALVRALTGVETDRLAEERRRGLTIDLGFAYQRRPAGILGFVDVPGHERFVRTMIAGVACIDHALVVVAADDGPMPQTVEHVQVLDLLGVARASVALTKADKVAPGRLDEVRAAVAALLAPTTLAGAPAFAVSAVSGEGIPALAAHFDALLERPGERAPRDSGRPFRHSVDRVFTLAGVGLVATGAVFAGEVRVGDAVVVAPGGHAGRVRAIHAEGAPAGIARAGERCALALAGVDRDALRRGAWIVAQGADAPTARFDARVRVLAGAGRPLRDGTPVHLHHGAADVAARIAVLEGRAIAPGGSGRAQLVLEREIACVHGDRFVLRDQSARHTIGGGVVLDPFGPARGRARPERLAVLAAAEGDDAAALGRLLEMSPAGVDLMRFRVGRNIADKSIAAMLAAADAVVVEEAPRRAFGPARWADLQEEALAAISRRFSAPHDPRGVAVSELAHAMGHLPVPRVAALIESLLAAGRVERAGAHVRPPGAAPALAEADVALWRQLRGALAAAALRPPTVALLAEAMGGDVRRVERLLGRAAELGLVVRISRNRFILPETLTALGEIAEIVAAEAPQGAFSAAEFRDRAGIGRNVSIEVVEFFDRARFTRRVGERRRVVTPLAEVDWHRRR